MITRVLALMIGLLCAGAACGETSGTPAGGPGASGASSATGGATAGPSADATCPEKTPTTGTPCQGTRSCTYAAFLGCFPSSVQATCKAGRWDVPPPIPYTGPCPGDGPACPPQLPTASAWCSTSTLDGPPRTLVCEYTDPACVGPRVATCTGQWEITPCVPVASGGAGGEASVGGAGGQPSESGGAGGDAG